MSPIKINDAQLKVLQKELQIKMTPYIPHVPHPHQHAFLWLNHVQEVFFGGSAGGGKSDCLLMSALQYVDVPGYNAIMFRRTFADLNLPGSLIPRSQEWLIGTDARWNENDARWTFPSGATLSFGYMRNDEDRMRYRSAEFAFCVAKGTGILMADNSLRSIEDICIGDKVQTLMGPKPVLAVHQAGVRNLASIVGPQGSALVSSSHPLLTPHGWVSPSSLSPRLFGESSAHDVASAWIFRVRDKYTFVRSLGYSHISQPMPQVRGEIPPPVSFSEEALPRESYGTEFLEKYQVFSRPPWEFVPLTLYELPLQKNDYERNDPPHGGLHAWHELSKPNSSDDYPGFPSYGESHNHEELSSLGNTLVQDDSGGLYRPSPQRGAYGISPSHNPPSLSLLVHPYTKEVLDHELPASQLHRLAPAGAGECWDLTVSEASHYILSNGVISSNCGFDELTGFSKLQYTYMFSRLRKPKNINPRNPLNSVPIRMRAASNPGDRGHEWVKARFIKPVGKREDEPDEPGQRIYVPSRLTDNPSIDAEQYLAALSQLDEASQNQLIHGDWNAREPGEWVIPDQTWIDAAVELGRDIWETKEVPRDWDKPVCFALDTGEFTQCYIIIPMPNGGIYVTPSEVIGQHEDPQQVGMRILDKAEYLRIMPTVVRYDAAGIQFMRTFATSARKRPGFERLKAQKIPFGKYKRESMNYLRLLMRRTALGRQTRVIAIHPGNPVLISQLKGWKRKSEESDDVIKVNDHGPDAILAGVAPIAAANRAYVDEMLHRAKGGR